MSTHDYNLVNQTRTSLRGDLNDALAAIVSNNSSATEPATMYAHQWWADTTAGILKQRNAANTAWIDLWTLANGPADKATANTFLAAQNFAKGADVASAATTNIWATDGNLIHVTGTTGITSLGTAAQPGASRTVVFDGVVTLTHNASTLVLPGGSNHTTTAGEVIEFVADTTTKIVMKSKSSQSATDTKIAFSVHRNGSNQTLIAPGAVSTQVQFTSEDYDIGGCFSSYRFTPTVEDIYHISLSTRFTGLTVGASSTLKAACILKNGVEVARQDNFSSVTGISVSVEKDIYLNGATDYIEFGVVNETGNYATLNGLSSLTFATGHRTFAY